MEFKIKHRVLEYEPELSLQLVPRYNKHTLYGQPTIIADNCENAILNYLRMGACDNKPKPYVHGDTWIFDVLNVSEDQVLRIVKNLSLNLE